MDDLELRRRLKLDAGLAYREQVHLRLAALQWGEARLDELAEGAAGVLAG